VKPIQHSNRTDSGAMHLHVAHASVLACHAFACRLCWQECQHMEYQDRAAGSFAEWSCWSTHHSAVAPQENAACYSMQCSSLLGAWSKNSGPTQLFVPHAMNLSLLQLTVDLVPVALYKRLKYWYERIFSCTFVLCVSCGRISVMPWQLSMCRQHHQVL